jgi:hypothetical protein
MTAGLLLAGVIVIGLVFGLLSRAEAGQRRRIIADVTTARPVRHYDLVGEVLPPDETSLTPWQPGQVVPSYEVQNRQPRGAQTIEGGFLVPLATAAGTAICSTLAIGALAWVFGWPVKMVGLAFGLSLVGAWLWRIGVADRLLWGIETWTKTDLDGDGRTGRPAPAFAVVNPGQARAAVGQTVRSSATDERRAGLLAFLDRCYLSGTSEASHGVKASGPDREQYVTYRDALMALGLAAWRRAGSPRAGWELTADPATAKAICEQHVM